MGYAAEFRAHWRPVVAAAVGLAAGLSLQTYMTSLFAPGLIAEFNWSKSVFALIGLFSLIAIFLIPAAGHLTDRIGAKRTALIGIIGVPATFFALSFINDLASYFAISVVQVAFGSTTTAAVYSKVVAEKFDRARGLALALAISGPATVAALATPILSDIIADHGWRAGYQALAALSAALGLVALFLIQGRVKTDPAAAPAKKPAIRDYGPIMRSRAFWLIMLGMMFCNLAQALPTTQMGLVLMESGATQADVGTLLSLYAVGVIVGRFFSGLALDRFPAHIVAFVGMGLPGIGLATLASSWDTQTALAISVLAVAMSQGAEGDLASFLTARYFGIEVFGSVAGLVVGVIAAGSTIGTLLLSLTLALSDSFTIFLIISAVATFFGAGLFLLLGLTRPSVVGGEAPVAA